MSFKLKYKDKDGNETVEVEFDTIEQTLNGMILRGEDKNTGKRYDFVLSLAPGSDLVVPPPKVPTGWGPDA